MVVIRDVSASSARDSRNERTILARIKTSHGTFSASAPNGKSRGKFEAMPYRKSLDEDIKTLRKFRDYFSEENIDCFDDLKRIDDVLAGFVGANTLFALQSAALKAMSKKEKRNAWEIVNPDLGENARFPRLVGNCIGGGKHSNLAGIGKRPDFQEFLLIPESKSARESFLEMERTKKYLKNVLAKRDPKFSGMKNDEGAWAVSLNEREVLDILKDEGIPIGTDIAASSFYKRKKYGYENPVLKRDAEEQMGYVLNLVKNFGLFYIEDPFHEEDFQNFAILRKRFPESLVVGDDLTVTSVKRLKKAIEMESVNAVIVKPNQNGSLIEVKEVCEIAKRNGIKTVFSHRSGETMESILADLAFGFQADFIKTGITGKEREAKIKRLIEIEKGFRA
jgi:enolase